MLSTPLFAQDGFLTMLGIIVVIVLITFFGFLGLVLKYYKRCPSNRILVIYGKTGSGQAAICIHGGAGFVLPLLQDYAWLSLEPMQIEIPLQGVLSSERIRVNVPSVVTVAVGTTPELMQAAAIRLLGLSFPEIKKQVSEIILGEFRQVIGTLKIEQLNQHRDKLVTHIRSAVERELGRIGMVLINVAIAEVTDESGYILAIEQRATANAVRAAKEAAAQAQQRAQLEVDFGGSVPGLVAQLLEEGKLGEEDRREIRRLLEVAGQGQ